MAFPSLLHHISPVLTAAIRVLHSNCGDLLEGVNPTVLWLEIVRQHMPRLRKFIIGFDNINSSSCQEGLAAEWLESLIDGLVVTLFHTITELFRSMPNLRNLEFVNGDPTFVAVGKALEAAKEKVYIPEVLHMWYYQEIEPTLLQELQINVVSWTKQPKGCG